MRKTLGIIFGLGLLFAPPSFADAAQVWPLATWTVQGHSLVLNGKGYRSVSMFHVNVYEGALYLEKKSSDAAVIEKSPEYKSVQMRFTHDVSAEDVRKGWDLSFKDNCSKECDSLKNQIVELNRLMPDMKEAAFIGFDFSPTEVAITYNGHLWG